MCKLKTASITEHSLGSECIAVHGIFTTLSKLSKNILLLFINETCYSGSWTNLAPALSKKHDVLIEAASSASEYSWNYLTRPGMIHCSLFGSAVVNQVTIYPEKYIVNPRRR